MIHAARFRKAWPQDSRAGARSTINPAIQKLVHAIGLLAEPGELIHKLGTGGSATVARAEPQYDITSRAAGYDLFLIYLSEDREAVGQIARSLERMGLRERAICPTASLS